MSGLVLALLLSLLASVSASAGVPEGKTQYEVRYKWGVVDTRVANAVFMVTREERDGQPALHSQVNLRATPFFRLFLVEEYRVDLFLSADGKKPLFSHAPLKKKGKETLFDVLYDWDARVAELHTVSVDENIVKTFPMEERPMDIFALFYFMQTLDISEFKEGEPLPLIIMMPRSEAPVLVCYEGIDTQEIPETKCHRFLLQFTGRGMMENRSGNTVHIWSSAEGDNKLLRLTVPLNNGEMVARIKQ